MHQVRPTFILDMIKLLAIAILLIVADAQQSQLEGPENTVSVAGSNVTLKCVSPSRNCLQIEWLKQFPPNNAMNVFSDRVGIYLTFRDRYSVDNSSGCDLVIRNINLTDAGRFICRAIISSEQTDKAASLIILMTQPICAINASKNSTEEGDGVQMTCEVTYNATTVATMVWKGAENASAAVVNRTTISRSLSVVASAPVVPSFTCETSFGVDTEISENATNIPVASCATPAINFLYSVRNVTLSPSLSSYPPETMISCSAMGDPSPTPKWQEMENDGTWMDIQNGTQFMTMSISSKQYRCLAINVVWGRSYNSTSHVFLVNNRENDLQQSQLEGPENTWSVVGSNVALKCVSPSRNCHQLEWLKYIPDDDLMNIFNDRVGIKEAYRDRYSVDNSSGCNLVIKNVNLTDAGRFICRTFISSQYAEKDASLIVLNELTSSAKPWYLEGYAGVVLGVGIGIGFIAAVVLAAVAFAILIRLGCIEFHPKPSSKSQDDAAKNSGQQQLNLYSQQLTVKHPLTQRTGSPLVADQESVYAGLEEGRDVSDYESFEIKQKPKSKKVKALVARFDTRPI